MKRQKIIKELIELLENPKWPEVNNSSVNYAIKWTENQPERFFQFWDQPYIEIMEDGLIGLTWRPTPFITNLIFNEDGIVTWASYNAIVDKSDKGRFTLSE